MVGVDSANRALNNYEHRLRLYFDSALREWGTVSAGRLRWPPLCRTARYVSGSRRFSAAAVGDSGTPIRGLLEVYNFEVARETRAAGVTQPCDPVQICLIARPFGFDFSYGMVDNRICPMSESQNREISVFAAALDLPADQLDAYLDQACAGNTELREQVEALLRVHDDAGTFFDKLGPVVRPTSVDGAMTGSSDAVHLRGIPVEKTGDRIGRYKLLQQIGEGGCGVVYMAEQEEPVRRRVALKVIKINLPCDKKIRSKGSHDNKNSRNQGKAAGFQL
jgi:hypothetical protein